MNIQINFTSPEIRMIVLPDAKNRMYLHSSGQNTGTWRTDGWMDGQTAHGYHSCLHDAL